jgi:hypothetical protein
MGRDALPPIPPVLGVSAANRARSALARDWSAHEPRAPYVQPRAPEPLIRSWPLALDDPLLPSSARALLTIGARAQVERAAWFAYGYDLDKEGGPAIDRIMEPTGNDTPNGRPNMRTVSISVRPALTTIAVRLHDRKSHRVAIGIWIDKDGPKGLGYGWNYGWIGLPLELSNWREVKAYAQGWLDLST